MRNDERMKEDEIFDQNGLGLKSSDGYLESIHSLIVQFFIYLQLRNKFITSHILAINDIYKINRGRYFFFIIKESFVW